MPKIEFVASSFEMEALLWAMKSTLTRVIDCQTFKTYSVELVSVMQSPDEWPAFSNLLDEIGLLRVKFPNFSFSLILRSLNF